MNREYAVSVFDKNKLLSLDKYQNAMEACMRIGTILHNVNMLDEDLKGEFIKIKNNADGKTYCKLYTIKIDSINMEIRLKKVSIGDIKEEYIMICFRSVNKLYE